jgi:hypothetical protein
LGGFALVWVGFIAAGCFFAAGGDTKALSKTIVGTKFASRKFNPARCVCFAVLGCPAERYTLASLRYDLAKLRAVRARL